MFLNYYLSDDERRLNFGGASLDDWKRLVVGDNPSKSMEDILAYDSIIFKKIHIIQEKYN